MMFDTRIGNNSEHGYEYIITWVSIEMKKKINILHQLEVQNNGSFEV